MTRAPIRSRIASAYLCLVGAALALAACTAREASVADQGPTCGETATAMVEACAEKLDELAACIEVASVDQCDMQNLAHGRCLDDARGDVDEELRDAAMSRYLCEVDDEPNDDCEERIAACE